MTGSQSCCKEVKSQYIRHFFLPKTLPSHYKCTVIIIFYDNINNISVISTFILKCSYMLFSIHKYTLCHQARSHIVNISVTFYITGSNNTAKQHYTLAFISFSNYCVSFPPDNKYSSLSAPLIVPPIIALPCLLGKSSALIIHLHVLFSLALSSSLTSKCLLLNAFF